VKTPSNKVSISLSSLFRSATSLLRSLFFAERRRLAIFLLPRGRANSRAKTCCPAPLLPSSPAGRNNHRGIPPRIRPGSSGDVRRLRRIQGRQHRGARLQRARAALPQPRAHAQQLPLRQAAARLGGRRRGDGPSSPPNPATTPAPAAEHAAASAKLCVERDFLHLSVPKRGDPPGDDSSVVGGKKPRLDSLQLSLSLSNDAPAPPPSSSQPPAQLASLLPADGERLGSCSTWEELTRATGIRRRPMPSKPPASRRHQQAPRPPRPARG
jgi:hypothetical protein